MQVIIGFSQINEYFFLLAGKSLKTINHSLAVVSLAPVAQVNINKQLDPTEAEPMMKTPFQFQSKQFLFALIKQTKIVQQQQETKYRTKTNVHNLNWWPRK